MKVKTLAAGLLALGMLFAAVGCGDGAPTGDDPDGKLQTIEGLDEKYYPDLSSIEQYSGSIDVEIVLEGAYEGWAAVAEEYERLQNGQVTVNINRDHITSTYPTLVDQACRDPENSTWDIFQGNYSTNQADCCYNLIGDVYAENPYAGNVSWTEVLQEESYNPPDQPTNTYLYVIRSSSIVTCWYVNMTAFNAAVAEGYRNADGKEEYPVTWDDLMNLCDYMEKAGYEDPLGISGNAASLTANQFSWLTNVYGDQYYREMYQYININEEDALWNEDSYEFEYDDTDPYIEQSRGFNYSVTKLWNALLDENEQYMWNTENYQYEEGASKKAYAQYVGAKSDKYACLLEQFQKMSDYLPADFSTTTVDDMESAFVSSRSQSGNPMIFLDLTSCGLSFDSEEAGFELGMFEYPYMVCSHEGEKHVNTQTLRDVGGAGGFLSILAHDDDQNELNVDFLMFFLSPYGQAIYTEALYEKGGVPDGPSLVKYVQTPEAWSAIFDSISYDGPCSSPFFTYLLTNSGETGMQQNIYVPNMVKLLGGTMTISDYQEAWDASMWKGWDTLCQASGYNNTCWQRPGTDVTAAE